MERDPEPGHATPSKVDPPPVPPPIGGHASQSADCRTYEFVTHRDVQPPADAGQSRAGDPAAPVPFIYVTATLAAAGAVIFVLSRRRARKNGGGGQAPSRAPA